MPRHLCSTTLGVLSETVFQVVVLLDIRPEVVALHVSGICLSINLSVVGKVPSVEFGTRGRDIQEVGRCGGVANNIAVKDIRVAVEGIVTEKTLLVAVIDEAEGVGGIFAYRKLFIRIYFACPPKVNTFVANKS